LVLREVLRRELQLLRVRLLLTHAMLKASLSIFTRGGDDEQVPISSGKNPLAVTRHLDAGDRVLQARQQSFSILAEFLVKTNCSIRASNH